LSSGIDQNQLNSDAPPVPKDCNHKDCQGRCWKHYPQSRFPNWSHNQVTRSGIQDAIDGYDRSKKCVIYKLDVDSSGIFHRANALVLLDGDASLDNEWGRLMDDKVRSFVSL
jgi:hypothetical protein